MKRWLSLCFSLGASLLLSGQIALANLPPRTVVIGSDIAETLAELNALEGVVGRDDTSQFPDAVAALPSVGYLRHLAAEGIFSLAPERLIVSAAAGPREVLAQLETVGVEVIRIEQGASLETLPAKIRTIAKASGHETSGAALVASIEADLARLETLRQANQKPAPNAMFLLSHSGMTPMAAGSNTAGQAVIEAAGGRNAFSAFNGYKAVGAEAMIDKAPEVVIASHSGLEGIGGEARLWQLPGLALTPAGHQQRLIVCDDQALLGFGPRTPSALIELHHALYENTTTADNTTKTCWSMGP